MKKKYTIIVLAFILALAFLLRVYELDSEDIWLDEGYTVYYDSISDSISDTLKWTISDDYLPFYHILSFNWIELFGTSTFSFRFLSVIFGTASVFMIYLVASLISTRRIGIYSAVLLALSSFNIYFSQEARPYALLMFLALCSIYFYLKFTMSQRTIFLFCYIIFTTLILYTHGIAIMVLLVQNLYYFLAVRRAIRKWLVSQFSLLILYSPLFSFFINQASSVESIPVPDLLTAPLTMYTFSSGFNYYSDYLPSLIFGSILTIIFGLLLLKNLAGKNKNTLFLWLWLVMPPLIVFVYSFYRPFYTIKYFIYSSAPLYILVALSIDSLKKYYKISVILAILILSALILHSDFNNFQKERWSEVAGYIKEKRSPEEAIILNVKNSIYPFSYYFDKECFERKDLHTCLSQKGIYGVINADGLPENFSDKGVWLVLFNWRYTDREGTLYNHFNYTHELAEHKKYPHIELYYFNKRETTAKT